MDKCEKELKRIINNVNFPFIFLAVCLMILHYFINLDLYDDIAFRKVLSENSLKDFVIAQYNHSNCRQITESILSIVLQYNQWVFKIINVAMCVILCKSISRMFVPEENKRKGNWVIVLLFLTYPLTDMSTAGWGATCVNYLWTLSMGGFALIPLKKIYDGIEIRWYESILYFMATIFACNVEQMCSFMLGMYGLACLYYMYKKKINKVLIFELLLCVMSFIYIITCPGSKSRALMEQSKWIIDYTTLNFVDKLHRGITSTMSIYIGIPNVLFTITTVLIVLCVEKKYRNKFYTIIASIPITFVLAFGLFRNITYELFPNLIIMKPFDIFFNSHDFNYITAENYDKIASYIPTMIILLTIFALMISIYLIFGNTMKSIVLIIIGVGGILTRVIMGFSPTLYSSSTRTYIILYFVILIYALSCYLELEKYIKKDICVYIILSGLAFLSYTQVLAGNI